MIAGRGVSVRLATADDHAAVQRLVAEALERLSDRRGGSEAAMIDPFAADCLLVAHIGSSPAVGFAAVDVLAPRCTIRSIFVGGEFRDVGVGAGLLGAVCDLAIDEGCRVLDASALPGDRDTKNFFETHGLTAREIIVQRRL